MKTLELDNGEFDLLLVFYYEGAEKLQRLIDNGIVDIDTVTKRRFSRLQKKLGEMI